jgi:hypothetical protein
VAATGRRSPALHVCPGQETHTTVDQGGSWGETGERRRRQRFLKTPPPPTTTPPAPQRTPRARPGVNCFFQTMKSRRLGYRNEECSRRPDPVVSLSRFTTRIRRSKWLRAPAGAGDETFRGTSFAVSLPGDDRFLNARERSRASSSYE